MDDLLALYDHHLRVAITYPGVRKEAFPRLVRFLRPAPGMNFVAYSRLDEGELDAVIAEQIAYFSGFDQPFSWHVCEHDRPAGLRRRLEAHGFAPDDEPDAVMVLDLHAAPPPPPPPGVEVRRLERPEHLDDVVRVEQEVLGGDFAWLKRRLGEHLQVPGYLSVYVAYLGGRPATSGWVYFHADSPFAGLFGGATVAEHRGRGLYSAVLGARMREAKERGYRYLTTGASPMSRPILERSGFWRVTWAYAMEFGLNPARR